MTISPFPFNQNLFRIAFVGDVDLKKNKRYVIDRVITRGRIEDFDKLLTLYSKKRNQRGIKKSKEIDPKTRQLDFFIPGNELNASLFYTATSK